MLTIYTFHGHLTAKIKNFHVYINFILDVFSKQRWSEYNMYSINEKVKLNCIYVAI